jgi:hypothetical protein
MPDIRQEASHMRHLIGFGLAVALAAAVFFAATWGYLRLLKIPVVNGAAATLPAGGGSLLHDANVLYAFAALAGTALLAGICVAVRRISPLAAGLPGLAAIAWTVLYGFSVSRAVRYIPLKADAFGHGFEAMLFNGVVAAAGVALVVPLFIPSRWRSPARPFAAGAAYADRAAGAVTEPEPEPAPATTSMLATPEWAETAPISTEPYRDPRTTE